MKRSHIFSDHNPSCVPETTLVGLSWKKHKNYRIWLCLLKWVPINAIQIANKNVLVTVMLCILINRHLLITVCAPSPYNMHSHRGTEKNNPCPKGTRIYQWNRAMENEVVKLQGREHGRSLGKGRPMKPESQKRGSEKLELRATCLCYQCFING